MEIFRQGIRGKTQEFTKSENTIRDGPTHSPLQCPGTLFQTSKSITAKNKENPRKRRVSRGFEHSLALGELGRATGSLEAVLLEIIIEF